MVAPDDDAALIALTNGSSGAMRWLPSEMDRLLRTLLGVPTQKPIVDVALQPETWEQICGRYVRRSLVTSVVAWRWAAGSRCSCAAAAR